MDFRAVIFDLGGVVLSSPLHAIADFERERDIPKNFINRVVMDTAPHGAWSRLERGELAMPEFIVAFEADCRAAGREIDAADFGDEQGMQRREGEGHASLSWRILDIAPAWIGRKGYRRPILSSVTFSREGHEQNLRRDPPERRGRAPRHRRRPAAPVPHAP